MYNESRAQTLRYNTTDACVSCGSVATYGEVSTTRHTWRSRSPAMPPASASNDTGYNCDCN